MKKQVKIIRWAKKEEVVTEDNGMNVAVKGKSSGGADPEEKEKQDDNDNEFELMGAVLNRLHDVPGLWMALC